MEQQMALQEIDPDLLSLDDFIPPHLQKKQIQGSSKDHNGHTAIPADNGAVFKATMVFTSEDTLESTSPRVERRWIRYDGIGPTDDDGMPFASRSSVDKPRQWYKNMFRVLHQMSDSEGSDSEEGSKLADQHTQSLDGTYKSRFIKDLRNDQPKLGEQSRTSSQESSSLRITVKSTIRESPSKSITTSNTQSSPDSSSIKTRATTLPRQSPRQPAEAQLSPRFSSGGSQFTISSDNTHAPKSSTVQPPRALSHHSQTYHEKQKPTPLNLLPDRSFRSSQVSDSTPVASKDTSSTQFTSNQDKYSSLRSTTSTKSPSYNISREPTRRSTSKILEQLETDLRQFTDELDKDLQACEQRSETTQDQCEEILIQRSSVPSAGGSPEPTTNRQQISENTQALSPISKAVVKFDFVAESEKELSLKRGTTVNILKKVDKNWLLGEQDGRRGRFPENYARILSPGQAEAADTPQLSAIALYNFKADSAAELPLRKGQRVAITKRVDGRWFEGRIEGSERLGLFPASYVQVHDGHLQEKKIPKLRRESHTNSVEQVSADVSLREQPCMVKAPASSGLRQMPGTLYRAVFNFSPNNPDELQLAKGDIVTVTQRCDDGWHVGVCWRTQKFGTFPGNFVAPCVASEISPN
ncbi:vinexin isoform X3 [Pseudophryne corroboree]|uniref:vinexin isoform X3 n=1 Tax=Pseudophryne corroboree TaxID=495146 RepID=UPI003081F7AD